MTVALVQLGSVVDRRVRYRRVCRRCRFQSVPAEAKKTEKKIALQRVVTVGLSPEDQPTHVP